MSSTNGHQSYETKVDGGAPLRSQFTAGGHIVDTSQPGWGISHRKFANPAPLGLMGFASTTLLLSFVNTHTRGLDIPNIVVSMALAYGGLVQLLAGAAGNTFGFTAFSSYGGFWISYGIILWPTSKIPDAYEGTDQFEKALGLYLSVWMIVSVCFLIASLRSSAGLVALFSFLVITFILLACGALLGSDGCNKAGGAFGIITSFLAYYNALAGMLTPDTSYFLLPTGDLSRKNQ